MSFLIIDSDQKFSDKLASALSEKFGGDTHIKENSREALALIELLDDFKFIIAVKSPKEGDLVDKIIAGLNREEIQSRPHIIMIGGSFNSTPKVPILLLPLTVKPKELIQVISNQEKYKDSLKAVKKTEPKSYASIPIRLFTYLDSLPCDAFLKIHKEGQNHFIKRFNKDHLITLDELDQLVEKGARFLYINQNNKAPFFRLLDRRFAIIAKNDFQSFSNESDLENYAFHSLHKIGISKSSLMVAREATKKSQERLESNQNFQKTLKDLLSKKKLGLKQLNSKVTSLLCYYIIRGSEFDQSSILGNLVMASYLQDIKINDELCSIRTQNELHSLLLEDKDNILVDTHAKLAAQELESYDSIPNEVIKIVRQHHGSIEGKGFTNELKATLSSQSILFLLAEEISFSILKAERKRIDLNEILESIYIRFNNSPLLEKPIENLIKNISASKNQ